MPAVHYRRFVHQQDNPNPDYLREASTDKGNASLFWRIPCETWASTLSSNLGQP
ncbi:hypothetical protein MO867_09515 [Microbulbifer sp. OS29]|uniref:Uncharacterized protein n=1 Tax=Microbulbifer okhotskensis TaxID=2926617 RepID=A0A9X2J6F9_9GAMM|nr:hypothetical protein [Microbulbifer okhotskensis]MCO1334575.1 hypothetical protein [Microbulbifer okhotskensis]